VTLSFTPLHPSFVAAVSAVDLRTVEDVEALTQIRAGMDRYGVLVFPGQQFSGSEQIAFAKRLDGTIHAKTGARVLGANRLGNEALTDISNVGSGGEVMQQTDRRRLYGLGNRLWHTDASFENPRGRYSMLMAYVIPPDSADTEFADTRTAYDTLPETMKRELQGLNCYHSIAHSRHTLGFDFSADEANKLPGATHPLVLQLPRTGRKSLYLASHASRIDGWTLPEGRLLLRDLMEHATARELVYRHQWTVGDLVIWDNRATMHRGKPFADTVHRRELRRVTTLDVEDPAKMAAYT
jgi:alpha-ketoglutarate-dependent 2,4-dichlorophenoxyacetate dioxygenase